MKIILPVSIIAMIGVAFAAQAEMKLPDLKKQPSAQAVLDEHFEALNKCDWNRLLAQYPEDAQINLPNGAIVKGRAAIGDQQVEAMSKAEYDKLAERVREAIAVNRRVKEPVDVGEM